MKNLFDRFWWFCNRKPNSPTMVYFAVAGPWFMIGFIILWGLSLIGPAIIASAIIPLLMGIGVVIAGTLLGLFGVLYDKKHGYSKALHKVYMAHRDEVAERLGKKP